MKTLVLFVLFILKTSVSAALFSLQYRSEKPNHLVLQTPEETILLQTGRMASVTISLLQNTNILLVSIIHESLVTSFETKYTADSLRLRTVILGAHSIHLSFQDENISPVAAFDGFEMKLDLSRRQELDLNFVGEPEGAFEIYFEEAVPEPSSTLFLLLCFCLSRHRNFRPP
jgi:hypothetical protein